MKYTVYKIVNKINGKIYIGCHKTYDLEDGYMGSGTILKRAIDKYGIENFEKQILEVFDNSESMFEMESKLVNPDDPNSYNIKKGGLGGWDHLRKFGKDNPFYGKKHSKETLERISQANSERLKDGIWITDGENDSRIKKTDDIPVGWKRGRSNTKNFINLFLGKKHSDETKRKIGEANKKLTGSRNGSFGTMWVTNGIESKKISKTSTIPDGWKKGRVM